MMVRTGVILKRLNIDRRIVYDVLQNRLSDLDELKKVFTTFL